jgi:tetratricopeptide (TPR) repeat protein
MKYFLINNSAGYQIYSNIGLPAIPDHSWIYNGLLYKLVPDKRLPTYDELIAENDRLWNSYAPVTLKDEISGSYLHLFSAELLNYSIASMNFARYLVENGFGEEGLNYIDLSIAYGSDQFYLEQYRIRGSALYLLKRCNESIESFDKALAVYGAPDALIYNYKAIVYEDCLHDSASAEKMKKLYEKEANKQSKSLPQ